MSKPIKDLEAFEAEFCLALKSSGYLFPTTDGQMKQFLDHAELVSTPPKYRTPDFIFKEDFISVEQLREICHESVDYSDTPMYAMAARNGKNLPQHVLDKMKEDKKNCGKK